MCIKIMTTGKNTKIRFVINMNLVLESFKSPSEARDLKLQKSKCSDLRITGSGASYSNSLFHIGLQTGFSLWKTI